MVGISTAVNGDQYGTHTSTSMKRSYSRNELYRVACVVFRCPTNESEYTAVDLQIVSNKGSQCRFT